MLAKGECALSCPEYKTFVMYRIFTCMSSVKSKLVLYLALAALLVFTIADGIDNYNSGVYADAHGLDGASVGWFAPIGLLVFVVSVMTTFALGAYLFSHRNK